MPAGAAYGPALGGAARLNLRGGLYPQQVAALQQQRGGQRKAKPELPSPSAVRCGKSANHESHFRQLIQELEETADCGAASASHQPRLTQ